MPPKPRPAAGRLTLARSPSQSLATIIRSRGLTSYEVGKLAGIDQCMIARFLRGERDLRLATLDKIAAALGLDLVERSRGRGRPSKVDDQVAVAGDQLGQLAGDQLVDQLEDLDRISDPNFGSK